MAKRLPRGAPPKGRIGRVTHTARRLWPVALEAWRRWERLPQHEKDRYRGMAGDAARRGRETLASRRAKRPRGKK